MMHLFFSVFLKRHLFHGAVRVLFAQSRWLIIKIERKCYMSESVCSKKARQSGRKVVTLHLEHMWSLRYAVKLSGDSGVQCWNDLTE
jgi:hypothetical protein